MIFHPTTIAGAFLIELEPRRDERGSFARAFCRREFEAQGITFELAQANLAQTTEPGTVRGVHYQDDPPEQKIVRCLRGAVFDVLIDLRPQSPTRYKVFHTRLDPEQRLALFIPSGVAHGYQSLEPDSEFMYLTDEYYAPGLEKGLRHDDPILGVHWPLPPRNITLRDQSWPDLVRV